MVSRANAQDFKQNIGYSSHVNLFDRVYDSMFNQTLSYSRTTSFAELIANVNHANKFNSSGLQFGLDAYPKFGSGMYGYVSYAFSNSFLFTDHRFGAEFFSPLVEKTEASIGLRFLHFKSGSSTIMYTGSISYYYTSYLFTFRPYLIPTDSNLGTSIQLSSRKYFNEIDYLTLRLGFGVTVDEKLTQLNSGLIGKNIVQLQSQNVAFSVLKKITNKVKISYGLGLSRDELLFKKGSFVLMTTFEFGFKYAF